MKRLILLLASVLLVIYILLSLSSLRDGYSAERELWGIDRKLNFIAAHQESTPDFAINQLANRYLVFINKYNKTIYAKQAQLKLGDLYSLRRNYAQARLEYQKAVCSDKELSSRAEVTIAKTYELEGNWDKALAIYKGIIRDYPMTNSGFFVPMYLANHLVATGDQDAYTHAAFADALAFYQKAAVKYPKSLIQYNALRMIAICQLNQKNWSGTVKTMGEIILKYPTGKAMQEAVNTINLLCVTKLHDYNMGINIYSQFIRKYPDHLADPLLKNMIKDLRVLKNKNLVIRTIPTTTKK